MFPKEFLDELYNEVFDGFHTRRAHSGLRRMKRARGHEDVQGLAHSYAVCIAATVSEFADVLTQAVIARKRNISFETRTEIAKEALALADLLEEVALDTLDMDDIKIRPGREKVFMKELHNFSNEWTYEVQRKIRLQCLVTRWPSRRVLPIFRNRVKHYVFGLLHDNRELTIGQICAKIDNHNDLHPYRPFTMPEEWLEIGKQETWAHASKSPTVNRRMQIYFGKIKSRVNRLQN